MNHIITITLVTLSLMLSACGSRDSGGSAGVTGGNYWQSAINADGSALSCELPDMRRWVNANMHDYYLFYDQVPQLNLSDYADLSTLIDDLRVSPNDRYSHIRDTATSSAQFEQGELFGFGQRITVTDENRVRFTQVYTGSPFALAGVERGDYLRTINGKSPFSISETETEIFFGINATPAVQVFTTENSLGQIRSHTLTSTGFTISTVLDARVINQGSQNIGYLAFDSFLETSRAELQAEFADFKLNNVNELILDLRYNRGGRIDVARELASLISSEVTAGSVFTTLAMNDKYSVFNQSINFSAESHSLNLTRLVVLTTGDSCSASELIINGLRPFIEVVVIGETTCGKPYGTLSRESCGKSMNALQFDLVNAESAGGYFNGISADCAASDDLSHAIGSLQEQMLATSLQYLTGGTCQTPRQLSGKKLVPAHRWPIPVPSYNDLTGIVSSHNR